MEMGKIAEKLFPVLVAAVGWLIGNLSAIQHDITDIKSKMPALITVDGRPTDSPISAEQRHKLKEEIYKDIHDLQVRIKLLEERNKK
jgi:hypothetical protein